MRHDVLADVLSAIKMIRAKGRSEIVVKPISKVVIAVLELLKKEGYINNFELIKDGRGDQAKIVLSNTINDIGVIKPRFPVTLKEFEKYERRYLPAKDFGMLIVSTSKGIMSHIDAKKIRQGGVLLAYVY
ncbi:MAG: 30S ribosomal protein S8 [Candidatus Nanoarchaeia archaeon]